MGPGSVEAILGHKLCRNPVQRAHRSSCRYQCGCAAGVVNADFSTVAFAAVVDEFNRTPGLMGNPGPHFRDHVDRVVVVFVELVAADERVDCEHVDLLVDQFCD